MQRLPSRLLSYYGDDFSGSADVMEALSLAGIPTVMFLNAPTIDVLSRYEGVQGIGVAGVSRSMGVAEMDAELTTVFRSLRALGAPLVHYKICSTFDSSPEIGSIGRAIEIGQKVFGSRMTPVLGAAPVLGRYCAFGNLFARSGLDSPVYRLDRHPTMSRHPTTPMDESDLLLLLARQTELPVGLIDTADLSESYETAHKKWLRLQEEGARIAIVDAMHDQQLPTIGRLLWEAVVPSEENAHSRDQGPGFVVGSSGVEYALSAYWRASALLPAPEAKVRLSRAEPVACVSGSCSPVTARQIDYALERGFAEVSLNPADLVMEDFRSAELDAAANAALKLLEAGKSVIVHSSRGPSDPRIATMRQRLAESGGATRSAEIIGDALGELLRRLAKAAELKRVAVTGGDTAGFVARRLGVEALSFVAPVAPGSPVCRIHSLAGDPDCGELEIAFKGGQVGHVDYLVKLRDGVG